MKEVYEFLKACGTWYIATEEGDQPRVRPFGALVEYDGKLYTLTNNTKKVFAQLMANPKVEISGMANGKWIRLEAEAVRDDRREARKAVLNASPSLRRMYNEDDGIVETFYFKNCTASICSFTEDPVVYQF